MKLNTKNGVTWTGLDPEWKERLKNVYWSENTTLDLKSSLNSESIKTFKSLKKKLLDFAGEDVCLPFFNPDCSITKLFADKAVYVSKENIELSLYLPPRNCHVNASYLVGLVDPSLHLYCGYYMDKSGMWREHSWCVNPKTGNIIESTNEGNCYFGVNLSEIKDFEENFIFNNLKDYQIQEIEEYLEENEENE